MRLTFWAVKFRCVRIMLAMMASADIGEGASASCSIPILPSDLSTLYLAFKEGWIALHQLRKGSPVDYRRMDQETELLLLQFQDQQRNRMLGVLDGQPVVVARRLCSD